MTKVSRYPLSKTVQERIFEVFFNTVADLKTSQQVEEFLHEFLTPTEQMMLAKRLAIAVLLTKQYRYKAIMDLLKVSPDTK